MPAGKDLIDQYQIEDVSTQLEIYCPILTKKKCRTKDEILAQKKMQQIMKQTQEEISKGLSGMLYTEGSKALKSLIDRNIISVHDYGYDDFEVPELSGSYFGNLINAAKDQTAYPLFDRTSEDVIKSTVEPTFLILAVLIPR